jgi:hypothetical protein
VLAEAVDQAEGFFPGGGSHENFESATYRLVLERRIQGFELFQKECPQKRMEFVDVIFSLR